jgi:hypothetical protein
MHDLMGGMGMQGDDFADTVIGRESFDGEGQAVWHFSDIFWKSADRM